MYVCMCYCGVCVGMCVHRYMCVGVLCVNLIRISGMHSKLKTQIFMQEHACLGADNRVQCCDTYLMLHQTSIWSFRATDDDIHNSVQYCDT